MTRNWEMRIMTDKELVEQIHAMIRLRKDGYKELRCPFCNEKPFIERSATTPGYLLVRCKCGMLNMSERGI